MKPAIFFIIRRYVGDVVFLNQVWVCLLKGGFLGLVIVEDGGVAACLGVVGPQVFVMTSSLGRA